MVEKKDNKKKPKKNKINNQINVKNNCLVFFKWMAFSPFHPPSSERTPTWFMHDGEKNGFYHWTRHSCSSNTIHGYHEGREEGCVWGGEGGGWQSYNILAHITGKLVCIFPCNTRQSFCGLPSSEQGATQNEMVEELRKTTEAIGWIYI